MNVNDPKIADLRAELKAAQQEFDMAVTFHEVWKPAAYDDDLHRRMGVSYATHAFRVVRLALRREMLLALMRLWDKPAGSVRMDLIAPTLRNKDVINALAAERAARIGLPGAEVQMRKELGERACAAVALISKYSHGAVRDNLKALRDERLAHRQIEAAATGPNATDGEIYRVLLSGHFRTRSPIAQPHRGPCLRPPGRCFGLPALCHALLGRGARGAD